MNFIKQIFTKAGKDAQSIKMVVRSNERGPQGAQGEKGDAATLQAGNTYVIPADQNPQVINTGTSSNAVFDFYLPKGIKGDDGAIHYTPGTGIKITDENVIEATGEATAAWGGIQGNIANQADLQNEFAQYAKTADLPTVNNATLTIQNNGTDVATFTANSATNTTANIVSPVQVGSVTEDYVAQLTNNASHDIYPVAGDLIANSVDTDAIQNGAVTNAKIANGAAKDRVLDNYLGTNVDLDTITQSGFYNFSTPYTNSPVDPTLNAYGSMLVISYSTDYRCTQIFIPNPEGNASVFVRNSYYDSQNNARAWGQWRTLSDGNDGFLSLSEVFTPATGFTVDAGYAFLKANTLLLSIGLHKDSGNFTPVDDVVGTLQPWTTPPNYVAAGSWLSSGDIYSTSGVGYLFIDEKTSVNAGKVKVNDPTSSHQYVKIYIQYPLGS